MRFLATVLSTNIVTPFIILLGCQFSLAVNFQTQNRGESTTLFNTPAGLQERCIISQKWRNGLYKESDIKTEKELCSFDFYSNIGICPKYNSTNPAVLLVKPTDVLSKTMIDASNCNPKKMNLSVEAKFKQSLTCSYAPSPLAYYQISRILGGAGRVPVAVVRTMDRRTHWPIAQKAIKALQNSTELIASGWRQFGKIHSEPANYPHLVDDSQNFIFGALVDNVKGEYYYNDVSGIGDYETRYERFMARTPFLNVSSSKNFINIAGSTEFKVYVPIAIQMRDVADMVLLDTLLNQQDRIGNVHYKFAWHYLETNTAFDIDRVASKAKIVDKKLIVPSEEIKKYGSTGALVKELILKDNDCGVTKENRMRKFSVLEQVKHISYRTYKRYLSFHQALQMPETKSYFLNEMLFTERDFTGLLNNSKKAHDILFNNCLNKSLKFDIELEDYLPNARIPERSCS